MSKLKTPNTPAIRFLKSNDVEFEVFIYNYLENGGTAQTAEELNVNEHDVIKTLVLTCDKEVFLMLMHGDKEVSLKELARKMNCKSVAQCDASSALKATGYIFGGTSPFGTKKTLKIAAEDTIFALNSIYINGGKQGLILKISPKVILSLFDVEKVSVAI